MSDYNRVFSYSAPSGPASQYSGSSGSASQYSDRSAIPSSDGGSGSTATVVIASILVVLILGFAVAALVIAMNGGDDGWDDGATEDWQEQIVEDIDQNEANIDYLEGEVDALAKAVGGGGSQKKPASSSPSADSGAQMTQAVKRMQAVAVPTASAASIKSQLFDASGASATLDDVFDTTKALHKAVTAKWEVVRVLRSGWDVV